MSERPRIFLSNDCGMGAYKKRQQIATLPRCVVVAEEMFKVIPPFAIQFAETKSEKNGN